MDIRRKFLKLTKRTYPYGTETQLVSFLPKGYFMDKHGNYYYKIGDSRTAFTCHLDTACKTQTIVNHKIEKNIISTDGKSILGADDKAGMTVLLYMMEKNVPGLYCFFIGEEVGCIGSGKACYDDQFNNYDRMVSFDRRGTKSIITFQSSKRCCSDEFANELATRMNKFGMSMEPDNTGVYTDSAEFVDVIPECTNISVGYYREHTHFEHQDIDHLIKLCIAVTKINWETLPVKRDKTKVEYKSYSYSSYNSKGWSSYDYDTNKYGNKAGYSTYDSWSGWDKSPSGAGKKSRRSSKRENYGYYDDFYFEDEEKYEKYSYDLDTGYEKVGRSYYDSLDNDITDSHNNQYVNKYSSLREMVYDDRLTDDEVLTLKDQYFDLTDREQLETYIELRNQAASL
jgi:hypothetical protein